MHCKKSMTNREEEELLSQGVIADHHSGDSQTQTATLNTADNEGVRNIFNGHEGTNNAVTPATEIAASDINGIITDLHWSENPPASASPSSGFSDDDSLTGANDIADAKTIEQIVEMVKQLGKKGLIKE